jgi:hypothetical protein
MIKFFPNSVEHPNKTGIVSYSILVLLCLVAFNFGGDLYLYLFEALAFVLAAATFPLALGKENSLGKKDFGLFFAPVLVLTLFLSFSRFWLSYSSIGIASDLLVFLGTISFFLLGYTAQERKRINPEFIIYAIYVGITLLVLISTIYGLIRYGAFYSLMYKGQVYYYDGQAYAISEEMKLLIGFSFEEVSINYGSVFAFISATALLGLLFVKPKENIMQFIFLLVCGLVGVVSLLLIPNFNALFLLAPLLLFALIVRYVKFGKEPAKIEKMVAWSVFGAAALLLLVVFINAIGGTNYFANIPVLNKIFNNGQLLAPINEIINAVFRNGSSGGIDIASIFGGALKDDYAYWIERFYSLANMNNVSFEFAILFEGGILAFIALCVFMLFTIGTSRKYLFENGSPTAGRFLLVTFLLASAVYLSFSGSFFPYIKESMVYVSPLRGNPIFLLSLFVIGFSYRPLFYKVIPMSELPVREEAPADAKQ